MCFFSFLIVFSFVLLSNNHETMFALHAMLRRGTFISVVFYHQTQVCIDYHHFMTSLSFDPFVFLNYSILLFISPTTFSSTNNTRLGWRACSISLRTGPSLIPPPTCCVLFRNIQKFPYITRIFCVHDDVPRCVRMTLHHSYSSPFGINCPCHSLCLSLFHYSH